MVTVDMVTVDIIPELSSGLLFIEHLLRAGSMSAQPCFESRDYYVIDARGQFYNIYRAVSREMINFSGWPADPGNYLSPGIKSDHYFYRNFEYSSNYYVHNIQIHSR